MSKASNYSLVFNVVELGSFGKSPFIDCMKDSNGFSINSEIAVFMNRLGEKDTQQIINEINGLDAFNRTTVSEYYIDGSYDEMVEINSSPATATFNNGGGDIVVPLQDFIDLLQEWKNYLNALPYVHTLSGR